jgi:hypothetical protein
MDPNTVLKGKIYFSGGIRRMRLEKPCHLLLLAVGLISFLTLSACSSMGGQSNTPPPNPVGQQPPPAPSNSPSAGTPASSSPAAPRPLFYDFPDIPVPQELDLQSKESYVVQSGSIKTGILTLRGRVDLNSLINFFQMAMLRENWKPKGYFRYQRIFYTYVEIFVTPASS